MAEIARALRFVNVALGAWVVVSPFVLDGAGTAGMIGGELSHQETKDMAPIGGKRLAAILTRLIGDFA